MASKAAKKKEAKLKAQVEFRKTLQREAFERELVAQAYHRGKLEKSWKESAEKITEPVLRQEIQVLWHTFERAYDKKDQVISAIMKLMNVADDQYQRTFPRYCVTADTMINNFMRDLEVMSKENDRKTSFILNQDVHHKESAERQLKDGETHLQLLMYWRYKKADELAWTTRGEIMVKEDEYKTQYSDVREDLRSFLEDKFNALWTDYKSVLKAYVVGTAENQREVRKLRQKNNMMMDIIAAQAKKIANSGNMLKRLRSELGSYESGSKQAIFRDRRDRHRNACQKLKRNLYIGVDTDVRQLKILVKNTDEAVESLEAKNRKIEKILRMAALCRKFETHCEKVLPYGTSMLHSPIQVKTSGRKGSEDSLVANEILSTGGLTGLWQRMAKAELTKRALFQEKMMLEHENSILLLKIPSSDSSLGRSSSHTSETYKCICDKANPSLNDLYAVQESLEISKINLITNY